MVVRDQLPGRLVRTNLSAFGNPARAWLDTLPDLIAQAAERWSLRVSAPYPELGYNYVLPAQRTNGTPCVLKVCFPRREVSAEAATLQAFDGRGMIRLLDAEVDAGLLLLERAEPGQQLTEQAALDDQLATEAAAGLMERLRGPAASAYPFPSVGEWMQGLAKHRAAHGGSGPLPGWLLHRAERLAANLLATERNPQLLHGDLHHLNILAARREPWLAIDPQGVIGDPEFEPTALLRNPYTQLLLRPNARQVTARRLDHLAERLGYDRERMRDWGIAQTVLSACWSVEKGEDAGHWIACAELLVGA